MIPQNCFRNEEEKEWNYIGCETMYLFWVALLGLETASSDSKWLVDVAIWADFAVCVQKRLIVIDLL